MFKKSKELQARVTELEDDITGLHCIVNRLKDDLLSHSHSWDHQHEESDQSKRLEDLHTAVVQLQERVQTHSLHTHECDFEHPRQRSTTPTNPPPRWTYQEMALNYQNFSIEDLDEALKIVGGGGGGLGMKLRGMRQVRLDEQRKI